MGFLSGLFARRPPRPPPVQPTHIDDENFIDEVARSPLPVVLDVWSPGCSPCAMLEPIVMDLARDYQGRVKVAELNAAEAMEYTARFGIMGTPTILFFKRGREVHRVTGFIGSRYLREVIEAELLAPNPGGPARL
jgi:thioredoxin